MNYHRLPEGVSPLDRIESVIGREATESPYLSIVILNQQGEIALINGNREDPALYLPEGSIYRPRPEKGDTVMSKVIATVCARTHAVLGSNAVPITELISLLPFEHVMSLPPRGQEQLRWPNAKKRLYIPAVAPTMITGEDSQQRNVITWAKPSEAADLLANNYLRTRASISQIALATVIVTAPEIEAITARFHPAA